MFLNLSSVDGECFQMPNPGGLSTVLAVTSRTIAGSWPRVQFNPDGSINYAASSFTEGGEVKELPLLLPDKNGVAGAWSQYMFPNGTAMCDCDSSGDNGYQSYKHSVELMMAGFSVTLRAEMRKHLNAGTVYIMQMKGGEFVVVGSSDDPIFAKTSFKGGKSGKDKRGYTLKGDSDGMMWDFLVVPPALVAQMVVNPLA